MTEQWLRWGDVEPLGRVNGELRQVLASVTEAPVAEGLTAEVGGEGGRTG